MILCQDRSQVFTNSQRVNGTQLEKQISFKSYIYDDDDGEGDDDDDANDVNRAPTAFARRNYQQPESYKSSLQKH